MAISTYILSIVSIEHHPLTLITHIVAHLYVSFNHKLLLALIYVSCINLLCLIHTVCIYRIRSILILAVTLIWR